MICIHVCRFQRAAGGPWEKGIMLVKGPGDSDCVEGTMLVTEEL